MTVDLVEILHLAPPAKGEAADLVYQSLPAYYDLFGFDKPVVISMISEQFHLSGSEVSDGVALCDAAVAGICFGLPGHKVRSAQLVSLGHLRNLVPKAERLAVGQRVSAFASLVQPVSVGGRYLSRFAVRRDRRGSGIADRLLDAFLQSVPLGEAAILHVKRDNVAATRFYARHGFAAAPAGEGFEYIVMQRYA